MKIQRTTIGLVVVAALLGGFVYFYEIQGAPQRQTAETEARKLFGFQEAQVVSWTLKTGSQTLAFQRTPATPDPKKPNSTWTLQIQPPPADAKTPANQSASDASVAYLLNLLATGQRNSLDDKSNQTTLTIPASQAAEFGFDQPLATVEVKLQNQTTHRLILGKPNFNGSALYAQVDPTAQPGAELKVALVSLDFRSAVTRPLSEWKALPPSPAAKSPSPSPTMPPQPSP